LQLADYASDSSSPCCPSPHVVDLPEPKLAEFYAYWRGKRGERRWPSRKSIDPTEIPHLLPHLMITEVVGENRFRFRLMGTYLTERIGLDATGREFAEFEGDRSFGDFMSGIHRQMLAWGVPVYGGGVHQTLYGTEHVCRRVMCPLSEDDRRIDKVISCIVFVTGEDNTAPVLSRGIVKPTFAMPVEQLATAEAG